MVSSTLVCVAGLLPFIFHITCYTRVCAGSFIHCPGCLLSGNTLFWNHKTFYFPSITLHNKIIQYLLYVCIYTATHAFWVFDKQMLNLQDDCFTCCFCFWRIFSLLFSNSGLNTFLKSIVMFLIALFSHRHLHHFSMSCLNGPLLQNPDQNF